jgi:hypothetical protein
MSRLRHCLKILTGRVDLCRLERFMALENFTNALAAANAAADALIAKLGNDEAQLDAQAAAGVQALADKLNAAVNPPSPPPAA